MASAIDDTKPASGATVAAPARAQITTAQALLAVALLFGFIASHAATHYIRDGGTASTTGTGSCTGWATANACDQLPATLVRGDTYYLADGTYPPRNFKIANSGTTRITIKKATATDHGTDTNWVSTYGDGEAVFTGATPIFECGQDTGYITIDGKYGTKGVSGSFGIRVTTTTSRNSGESLWDIDMSGLASTAGNCDGWIVNYVDFDWNNGTAVGTAGATRGIWLRGGVANDNFTLSNSWIHHSSGYAIYADNPGTGLQILNNRINDNGGAQCCSTHYETFWLNPVTNAVIDGNEIIDSKSGDMTGWMMIGNSNGVRITNNLFYCTSTSACEVSNNGLIATWSSTPSNTNISIDNNTFVNLPTSGPFIAMTSVTNMSCRNNLVYTGAFGWDGCASGTGTASHNACGGGATCTGTNSQTGVTTAIFVDYANRNLHLASNTTAGTSLAATFTTDKDGLTRSFWSRGAYEFVPLTSVHVAPTATGDGSGSNWNNRAAWSALTFVRGNTYYLMDGTYGSKVFGTAVSGTSLITIKKATAADHGSPTGWTSDLGDGEAFFNGASPVWQFNTSYWVIDGAVGAGKATTPYGFHLRSTTSRCVNEFSSAVLFNASSVSNITWRYVDFDWNNGTSNCTSAVPALIYTQSTATADITMDRCYLHDAPGYALYIGEFNSGATQGDAQDRWIIQNSYFYNLGGGGGPDHHFEAFWLMNVNDSDFRYNWIEEIIDGAEAQTGWLMMAKANGMRVYGNVFTCATAACSVGGNGVVATWSSDNYVNDDVKIINNSFIDVTSSSICVFSDCGINFTHSTVSDTNIVVKNNLYYNSIFTWRGVNTQDHEACGGGQPCAGTSQQTGITTGLFTNYAGKNYSLASGTVAGDTTVGTTFAIDFIGLARGGDGTWDRGAYEFVSGSDTQSPTTPTNPLVNCVSTSQCDISWTASTDNVGIAGYNVERCSGAGCSNWAEVQVTSGTGTTWSNTGLSASTLYRYRIRARDAIPNYSGYSSIVEGTTNASVYTVTPSENIGATHGTITPSTPQSIAGGTTTAFTVTPDAGYQAFVRGTCGGSLVGNTYTTSAINAQCTVEANFIPSSCQIAVAGTPVNTAMTTQSGSFTYLFSVIPIVANHDIVLGHLNGSWVDYNSSATAVRFYSNGRIDVVSGAGYSSDVIYPYSVYTKYDVRVVVNIPSHTYSVWVAPEGGAETQIAANFAFRTSQAAASQLNNFGYLAATGTPGGAYVCPTGLSGGDTTAPTVQVRRVQASGTSFDLDLDEPAGSVSGAAGLTVIASGGAVTLAGCSTASDVITCSTSRQILGSETVTASYSGSGGIADIAGNPLLSFSNQSVINNSTQALVSLSLLTPPDGTRYRKEVSSTTVGLTTSKSASCRHAWSTGVIWSSMTPYTTTGSTSHSSIFPMAAGGGYRVCSRCLDTAAQQYSTDACTHFSVRSARKR